jgi:hypothetical protein
LPFCLHIQVGAFVTWYMFDNFMGIDLSKDGHSTVTWNQVGHRGSTACSAIDAAYQQHIQL